MEVIFVLLPLAIMLGVAFLVFFIWAAKSGQYDDLDTPSVRMLFDDDKDIKTEKKKNHINDDVKNKKEE
ncbi:MULTISPECIES: cbb3-type cytochrome oxidase assembly protein CcoS [unclassified Halobacteriovorax]|uniref:cbb3-type cytochrome oxidase assembly protein CcoS n=1 Tax=unclassified Halobacteriovorax TaxID=2639665 RepID=UPI000EA14D8A|nr:cbb3-type cytochrome oxidase assembly protein CcoS [Halobacteriovorax sp. BALOs_7]AYF44820.1 cytochrome oxidase maturation protein, cbb3-type [Halobacteriovorax sp. BALOs_7]